MPSRTSSQEMVSARAPPALAPPRLRAASPPRAPTPTAGRGAGTISTRDLGVLLRALGKSPTQEELQKLIAEVDPKGESNVDFKTLCHCMKKPMRQPDSENDVPPRPPTCSFSRALSLPHAHAHAHAHAHTNRFGDEDHSTAGLSQDYLQSQSSMV